MTSDTLFLTPRTSNSKPNFANATGKAQFTNYSQAPAGTLTNAQVETLVKGGIATAIADAKSSFINDPAFSQLFSQSTVVGTEGAFQGSANSRTEVVGNFSVGAYQKFSFNFSAALELKDQGFQDVTVFGVFEEARGAGDRICMFQVGREIIVEDGEIVENEVTLR